MYYKKAILGVALIICATAFVYFMAYFDYGMNIWDEGVPLSGALRIAEGEIPSVDFTAYAPGRYLLYRLGLKFSDGDVSGPRIVMAFIGGLICALIYLAGVPLLGRRLSLVPAALYLLMPSPYYYRFFTIALMGSIVILLHMTTQFSLGSALFMGVCGAITGWLREEMGIALWISMLLVTLAVQRTKKQRHITTWIPFIVTSAGWGLKFMYWGGWQGIIKNYRVIWDTMEESAGQMGLPWPEIWTGSYWRNLGLFFGIQDLSIWLTAGVLIGSLGYGITRLRRNPGWWIVWCASAFSFGLILFRPGYGNLQRMLPPIVILYAHMTFSQNPDLHRVKPVLKFLGGLWIVFVIMDSLWIHPFSYDSIGMCFQSTGRIQNSKMRVKCHPDDASVFNTLDRSLSAVLTPGQSLVCLPFHTLWNYSTGNLNPTYYEWLLPGMIPERKKRNLIHEFRTHSPDVVLLNDEAFDGYESRRFSSQYPELFAWLEREYYRWMEMDDFAIMIQIPDTAVYLLDETFAERIVNLKGQHQLATMNEIDREWQTIRQTGSAVCDMACWIPENGALHVTVVLDQSAIRKEGMNPHVAVYRRESDENPQYWTIEMDSVMTSRTVLLDLSEFQNSEGIVRLESTFPETVSTTWIKPVIVSLKGTDLLIDIRGPTP
jgi:hypothetical protein